MKMYSYKINYVCCAISMFGAVVSAATHQLGFLLINFFFAVWNWYIAEWKRGLQNEKNEDGEASNSSGDSRDGEDEE